MRDMHTTDVIKATFLSSTDKEFVGHEIALGTFLISMQNVKIMSKLKHHLQWEEKEESKKGCEFCIPDTAQIVATDLIYMSIRLDYSKRNQ